MLLYSHYFLYFNITKLDGLILSIFNIKSLIKKLALFNKVYFTLEPCAAVDG